MSLHPEPRLQYLQDSVNPHTNESYIVREEIALVILNLNYMYLNRLHLVYRNYFKNQSFHWLIIFSFLSVSFFKKKVNKPNSVIPINLILKNQ